MGSIFIRYGLKSGGGAPFLRRTRNAFGQLQTRTRTASTSSQLQTRTRTCNCTFTSNNTAYISQGPYTGTAISSSHCQGSHTFPGSPQANQYHTGNCSSFNYFYRGRCCVGSQTFEFCGCFNGGTSTAAFGGFSGWSATASCSPTNPTCASWNCNAVARQCQTATICSFSAFTAWSNTSSCAAANPACSNGAVNRQCQTIFSFREQDWTVFEEADECTTTSPAASSGAVQVECIAN